MKKTLIIFGNITFEGNKAIIHEFNGALWVDSDKATEIADNLCNIMEAYVIPLIFEKDGGNIVNEANDSILNKVLHG